MNAMIISSVDSSELNKLLKYALTDDIHSREMYMKGIDYSYYYEEN
jgi:cell filamentation protein